ncbi:MAG: divergent polysaccharide deacetylase family protein [Allorhizobium sp.]
MGADLHAPLGQDRSARRPRRRWLSFPRLAGTASVFVLLGLSVYSAVAPDMAGLTREPTLLSPDSAGEAVTAADANPALGQSNGRNTGLATARPNSGANIERTLTPDGNLVTKFTPQSRDGDGPVLIDAPRIGQDPRMAAIPNDDLLEDSPEGRIPVVGQDGLRSIEQYARPWSGARGTRIAIVVGGLGLSQTGTQRAIKLLPEDITLAFAATGNSLERWMQEARRQGHEILLQVPFEPFDYPANDPGRGTLLTTASTQKNLAALHEAMARITNYTGVMNYMGAKFLTDADALEPVIRDIAQRGLLFLDDGSSAQSLIGSYAKTLEMPHAFADVRLDDQVQERAILDRLDELERIALRRGSAIGVASAFDESIAAITKWADEAGRRGIEIVGVSALADATTE